MKASGAVLCAGAEIFLLCGEASPGRQNKILPQAKKREKRSCGKEPFEINPSGRHDKKSRECEVLILTIRNKPAEIKV